VGIRYYVNGQERDRESFSEGSDHTLREMLASRRGPALMTDSVFLEGMESRQADEFNNGAGIGDIYRKEAVSAGVNPHGKVYLSQLASFPGDPEAWVSGRGDIVRVCEKKGLDTDGAVKVRAARRVETPEIDVAEHLTQKYVDEAIEADPGLKEKPRADVREKVLDRIAPHWSKRKKGKK
jgi:hypothetical protein